jgi:hypothetical protein
LSPPHSDLLERQNSPRQLFLLRAVAASHARARRLEGLRLAISMLLALLGVVGTLVSPIADAVTVLGGLWALVHSVGLSSWSRWEIRRAALLQEMFDVQLYRLSWNEAAAGPPLVAEEISRLARRFRGQDEQLRDYYEIPELPHPLDVLACQEQNLGWGARVRSRYAFTVLVVVGAWSAGGLVLGSVLGMRVLDLILQFFVPSLGGLMMGLEIYRAQRNTAVARSGVLGLVRQRVSSVVEHPERWSTLLVFARQVQDVILQTRMAHARVPNLFFARFHKQDRIDFAESMSELSQLLNRASVDGE